MTLLEYLYEQQALLTEEEANALDAAAKSLADIEVRALHPERFAEVPPHLMGGG